MDEKKRRMLELVELLNHARRVYEQEDTEIMSNFEYDKLYDELLALEQELGTTLASSPTVNVGYEVLSELPKERHGRPMLSLDKTKEVGRLKEFLGGQKAVISWKMDGLTIVLTYQGGTLVKRRCFKTFPCTFPTRVNSCCAGRPSSVIGILRKSMRRLRTWTPNIKIPATCAAVPCAS